MSLMISPARSLPRICLRVVSNASGRDCAPDSHREMLTGVTPNSGARSLSRHTVLTNARAAGLILDGRRRRAPMGVTVTSTSVASVDASDHHVSAKPPGGFDRIAPARNNAPVERLTIDMTTMRDA